MSAPFERRPAARATRRGERLPSPRATLRAQRPWRDRPPHAGSAGARQLAGPERLGLRPCRSGGSRTTTPFTAPGAAASRLTTGARSAWRWRKPRHTCRISMMPRSIAGLRRSPRPSRLDPLETEILALALHYRLDQRVERLFDLLERVSWRSDAVAPGRRTDRAAAERANRRCRCAADAGREAASERPAASSARRGAGGAGAADGADPAEHAAGSGHLRPTARHDDDGAAALGCLRASWPRGGGGRRRPARGARTGRKAASTSCFTGRRARARPPSRQPSRHGSARVCAPSPKPTRTATNPSATNGLPACGWPSASRHRGTRCCCSTRRRTCSSAGAPCSTSRCRAPASSSIACWSAWRCR